MTSKQTTSKQPESTSDFGSELQPDDPRYGLAVVVKAVGDLIEATPESALSNSTPCPEFEVKDLHEHLIMVIRRIGAIGRGEHWSSVDQQSQEGGWAESFREGAHEVMEAWSDPAKLAGTYEVPWGEMPGGPLMMAYTGELAVHGWDLASATDVDFTVDDELLHGPLQCAKFIPAEGRDVPEMPFGEVVDPGPGAPVLHQLAGWMGRDVLAVGR